VTWNTVCKQQELSLSPYSGGHGEIECIWTRDELLDLNGISPVPSLKQRNTGRWSRRRILKALSLCLTSPWRGVVNVPLWGNPRRITNCKAIHSVLDFPQYRIECSVNRQTIRNLSLTYDVPYRSVMYLLYPCVNKIQCKTSLHIVIIFWLHRMLGFTQPLTF
jgi:hypothetical protein